MRYFVALLLGIVFVYSGVKGQEAEPAKKTVVQEIQISGNKVTRSSVILRELSFHVGDTLPADSTLWRVFALNRERLVNMQLFNSVGFGYDAGTSESVKHFNMERDGLVVVIALKERWNIIPTVTVQFADRNFNTWWVKEDHDLRRAMVGLTLTDKNFRGNLEQLAVTVQAGYTQKLGISYLRPYVNRGQTNGLGFNLSVAQSRQTFFRTDSDKLQYAGIYSGPVILKQVEGGVSYVYRPAYARRHIFQLNYKDYSVSDTVLKLNSDYYKDKKSRARFAELYYRYEYNGVDNWSYSLKGEKLVTQAVVRKGFEGLEFQAFANVEAGLFRSPAKNWYYSLIFRGRLMYPQDQPYFFRGGLGTQTDYVRGYEYYVIDGSSYGLLRFDLKRQLFNKTYSLPIKYFTALPVRIYPKVFADIGYIDGAGGHNDFLGNKVLYSIGAGLDVVTLYDIKIRLEFAWNHLKQNGLYLHFNSE